MNVTIRFVGGPADGRTLATLDTSPPPRYLIPLAPSISELMDCSPEAGQIKTAEYEPQFDGGQFRVAGDGAYLYRHRAAPLTRDERDALAQRRADVREAEERRSAELDEAWQEIRRERPGYPPDWRSIF